MRKNEIDWIRNIGVLLLFVFHTASIFTYYEQWYIESNSKSWVTTIIFILCIPWHMPILFFLAGASTKFSLESRGEKKYVLERVKRLLIPFIIGMLILVPPQGYIARISRGKPVKNYFEQWKYFWTTISDIPYDGGLGPAHLWFIFYLFIISLIGVYIIRRFKSEKTEKFLYKLKAKLISTYSLFFMIMICVVADMIPVAIAEKNILTFLIVFLMGYIVYDDNNYLEYIYRNKTRSLIISIIFWMFYLVVILYRYNLNDKGNIGLEVLLSILRNGIMVTMIVVIIGYAMKYLNRNGKILTYLNKACFSVYILHQTVIVIIANYLLKYNLQIYVSMIIILFASVFITFGIYEIVKRIKIIRILIGI